MEVQGNIMSLEQQSNVVPQVEPPVIQNSGRLAFLKELPKKLLANKIYLMIIVGVIVLAVVGYFVYKKYIKKTPTTIKNPNHVPLPIPIRQPSQDEIQMLQKQLYEQQQVQPKLNHPGNPIKDDTSDSPVQINESVNVTKHNLTASEVADINKKIEQLKSTQ
jgi:hypothetical protein